MRIASLCLVLLMLLACSCPARKAEAPQESVTAQKPAATEKADETKKPKARQTDLVIWRDPALGEPMKAFSEQVFIKLAKRLDMKDADLADIAAIKDNPPEEMPQIIIFGYAPMLKQFVDDGIIVEESARTFAGDRLVLAEKRGMGYETPSLFDSYKLHFNKLGYLNDSTALGKPSSQALVSDGLLDRIKDRTVEFASIRPLFGALLSGDIELAILPASLVAQSETVSPVLIIGADLHEDIRYIAAATPGNADDPTVQRILRMLAEDDDIQKLFVGYGMLSRKAALIEN